LFSCAIAQELRESLDLEIITITFFLEMFFTSKYTLLSIVMLFILLIVIFFITLSNSLAILFFGDYVQPIEAGIEIFSVLFLSNMLPISPSKRLTKIEKEAFSLSDELKQILVGLILGDLHVQRQTENSNIRLRFKQGLVNQDYLMHLYELFKTYCPAPPKTTNPAPDSRTGNVYKSVYFNTYSLPCFNEWFDLFYDKGTKIVPLNIGEWFSPLSLAYWISDDGYWLSNGVHICTESFTLTELKLLVKILEEKFDLKCTIYSRDSRDSGFRIRISSQSIAELQKVLAPIMPSMMRYKIGL